MQILDKHSAVCITAPLIRSLGGARYCGDEIASIEQCTRPSRNHPGRRRARRFRQFLHPDGRALAADGGGARSPDLAAMDPALSRARLLFPAMEAAQHALVSLQRRHAGRAAWPGRDRVGRSLLSPGLQLSVLPEFRVRAEPGPEPERGDPGLPARRQERRDKRPLPVGQVTCISAAVPRILVASGFVPRHVHLRLVPQPDRITNP